MSVRVSTSAEVKLSIEGVLDSEAGSDRCLQVSFGQEGVRLAVGPPYRSLVVSHEDFDAIVKAHEAFAKLVGGGT